MKRFEQNGERRIGTLLPRSCRGERGQKSTGHADVGVPDKFLEYVGGPADPASKIRHGRSDDGPAPGLSRAFLRRRFVDVQDFLSRQLGCEFVVGRLHCANVTVRRRETASSQRERRGAGKRVARRTRRSRIDRRAPERGHRGRRYQRGIGESKFR
jgi:hypothetical protein